MRHSCQKSWETTVEKWPAGKTESEIKLLIQENSKPQDLIAYTDGSVTKDLIVYTDGSVTKDLIVYTDGSVTKTTTHEDSAACTVSTSSLTVEVEALTHAPLDCLKR